MGFYEVSRKTKTGMASEKNTVLEAKSRWVEGYAMWRLAGSFCVFKISTSPSGKEGRSATKNKVFVRS